MLGGLGDPAAEFREAAFGLGLSLELADSALLGGTWQCQCIPAAATFSDQVMWQSYLVPPLGPFLWDSGAGGRFESVQGTGIPWFSSVLAALATGSIWQMHSCSCASAKELSVWEIYQ